MNRVSRTLALAAIVGGLWASWHYSTSMAQPPILKPLENPPVTKARFEFIVLTSNDARYLGDTPSHQGRNGIKGITPKLSLGDPVYREKTQIGNVTAITWDRGKEGLDIEFSPRPLETISVGDTVWVAIDGTGAKAEGHKGE